MRASGIFPFHRASSRRRSRASRDATLTRAVAIFVLLAPAALAGCTTGGSTPVPAGDRASSPAPQEARSSGPGYVPEAGAPPEGAQEPARGAPPPPGLVPPNASRVVAEVLKLAVWAPGTLPTMPRVESQQALYSLTLAIVSSTPQKSGQRNLARPGSTVEAFSSAPLARELAGKKIEGVLTLTGDTRGTRWWISNVLVLP
jgi:hypothetical protein